MVMDLELLKETKTRYLFIEILSILILGIMILIVLSKFCKIHITNDYLEIFGLVITLIWFFLTLRFMRRNNISIENFVGKPSKKRFIFEVPVTLIITYIGSIGLILLMLFLVHCINPNVLSSLQSKLVSKPPKLTTTLITIISFAGAVIVVPITEEFIFRGILMGRLYNKYGVIKSIMLSSFVFFIMHINPNPMLLCLGISCGILAYKYKSLIPSIILHMCNNLYTFTRDLNSIGNHTSFNDSTIDLGFFILGSILFSIYAIYVYVSLRKCRI
jgi:membrane protease YdiL (CAAX protease family)